jgi:peptidyl-dipeptidase Dcp
VKPYFELNNVLENGVFYAAQSALRHHLQGAQGHSGLSARRARVRRDRRRRQTLALFYCDYFKRDNKNGGAWMSNFVGQSKLLGTRPVIYNVANLQKPAPGEPALISFDDVITMFHEFGHALHGMLSTRRISQPCPARHGARLRRISLAVQ